MIPVKASEKKVVGLTITSEIYKSTDNCGKPCFAVDAIYALETGETQTTRITSKTKKGIPERIADRQSNISRGEIRMDGIWEIISYSIF